MCALLTALPDIENAPSMFVSGPAGSGKTTLGISRINALIESGTPADRILLLTPQRSYTLPYQEAFDLKTWYALGKATIGGLAKRFVSLFWPTVPDEMGFDVSREPTFLTYEVAQYFMARLATPLIEQGYFADLTLTRPRLYSQLLDNLNKIASNGRALEDLEKHLVAAFNDSEITQRRVKDISETVREYRRFCISHNLLDFSLSLEVFANMMRSNALVRNHLFEQFDHLIYDNLEEDIPRAHHIVRGWLSGAPTFTTNLLLYDEDAGYRRFLGADPESKWVSDLSSVCEERLRLSDGAQVPDSLLSFGTVLSNAILGRELEDVEGSKEPHFYVYSDRLHHEMVKRAAGQIDYLVQEGVAPDEIVVISPFLSDSLHYALATELDASGIGHYVHRPSRTLRDEPTTRVLLTLAQLAHPDWDLKRPAVEAVTHLFFRCLGEADLVRASLLASAVYDHAGRGIGLTPFERLSAEMRDRISYRVGERYERFRSWLEAYQEAPDLPLDHFYSRIFGELLSQPGFGFFQDKIDGAQVGSIVESARKFRQAVSDALDRENVVQGKAYIEMVQEGVVSAFYEANWDDMPEKVLIAPVHTFLLRNRNYKYQVWLDIGSPSWHRRIHQPLTNPYVFNDGWNLEKKWDSEVEELYEQERLANIVLGLVRRCSDTIYLYNSTLSAQGSEQTGDLLLALGDVLQNK